jgi:hypothetical protein
MFFERYNGYITAIYDIIIGHSDGNQVLHSVIILRPIPNHPPPPFCSQFIQNAQHIRISRIVFFFLSIDACLGNLQLLCKTLKKIKKFMTRDCVAYSFKGSLTREFRLQVFVPGPCPCSTTAETELFAE